MIERSVVGPVDHSQVVIGNDNTVIHNADRAPIRVSPPRRRATAERLLFGPDTTHPTTDRPLTWLRPDAGVVPIQPRPEDADLLSWCTGNSPLRVRLLCGRGGQGKTTTARQLVKVLHARKHIAGFLDLTFADDAESDFARRRWAEIEAALMSRPAQRAITLLVVDYAENEPLSLRRLLTLTREAPTTRVLLLSRNEGNWWPDLLADPTWSPLLDAESTRLESLATHLPAAELHADAVRRFADRIPGSLVPPDDLLPEFATTLDLYADALLRVLDAAAVERGEQPIRIAGGDPITDLLAHESRHVKSMLADQQIEMPPHDRDLVLAAPFLVPAPTLDDAVRLLRTLGLEGGHDDAWFRRVAKVLGKLYPDEQTGGVWSAPRPDRLPDTHLLALANRAASDGDWTDVVSRVAATSDVELAGHVLKALSRCLSTPGAERRFQVGVRRLMAAVDCLVRMHPKGYLLPALLLFPGRVTDAISEAVGDPEALSTADVAAVDNVLARLGRSTGRAFDVLHISRRLIQDTALGPDSDHVAVDRHARLLTRFSFRLAQVGQHEQAVVPAQRAVDLRQRLVADDPDGDQAALAMALTDLAARLGNIGRREQALIPAHRAIEIQEQLVGTDPDANLPRLAGTLTNLAHLLQEMGRSEQALIPARRSAEIWERLVEADPVPHLPDLATALNNLANTLAETGHREQALTAAERVLAIRESQAEANPDGYLPDLATALSNLANHLLAAGRAGEALDAAERSVEIRERLVDSNADFHLPHLAAVLTNLSLVMSQAGRRDESLVPARRAIDLFEKLAETNSDVYLDLLARSLHNFSVVLGAAGQETESAIYAEQAVCLYQQLVAEDPDGYSAQLAVTSRNLSIRLVTVALTESARTDSALTDDLAAMGVDARLDVIERAVEVFRHISEADVKALLPNLASALANLTDRAAEMDQDQQARTARLLQHLVGACSDLDFPIPGIAELRNSLDEVRGPGSA
ncbi:tetratricopeptide repeat protein [Lentzea sp. NBRC 102530]|uniref:tetratricopeptide repeat protein n=1 Tax=Lentzea sp. NBRC 102530 TaxID=3032201 RepID=UPI0024A2589E|nr:tetratricopeptide repeat protein [Lentzea sp. NBRC 102530]GLY50084.1 molecular chaperone Tir [Lentzea sp. NBRC 102530]